MADLKTYEFDVAMSCSGCSGAVERVLKRWKDNNPELSSLEYKTDLDTQKVTVTAPASLVYDDIFNKINNVKTVSAGREIERSAEAATVAE
ncbi:Metal homeostasis factor [Drechslerella dactyloides]|uniref:Metal homeostasis factor n=1 Tax=Drechslerella dactyloides TaxID=74499 RepID=A0AAD6IT86_DREDA|nr:Metal homeostasis factor [Drechslerella dactyloides]